MYTPAWVDKIVEAVPTLILPTAWASSSAPFLGFFSITTVFLLSAYT